MISKFINLLISIIRVIIGLPGDDLVSTGILEHRWQFGGTRYEQTKINAKNIKNALANVFGGNQTLAFA
jgi:hypothetical protein